ncbi:MAG: hypothetical protein AABX13_04910 [Nanoarchaeota archaeon]
MNRIRITLAKVTRGKITLAFSLILLLLMLVSCGLVKVERQEITISGLVTDMQGNPLEGVKITSGTSSALTTASGNYELENVIVETVKLPTKLKTKASGEELEVTGEGEESIVEGGVELYFSIHYEPWGYYGFTRLVNPENSLVNFKLNQNLAKSSPALDSSSPQQESAGLISKERGQAIQPTIVEGTVGEELTDGYLKLRVYNYQLGPLETYADQTEEGHFAVFEVEAENRLDTEVDFYDNLRVLTGLGDKYGSSCLRQAEEKSEQVFASKPLRPKEKRRGLIVCPVPKDTMNLFLFYDDQIPYSIQENYAENSKFGEIKVKIYTFAEIKDKLTVEGKMNEFVSNELTWNQIKVNSYELRDTVGTIDFSSYDSGGECIDDSPDFMEGYSCKFLIVELTVKNKEKLFKEEITSNVLKNYALSLGGKDKLLRFPYQKAYEMLDQPLNLENMAPGEERTGQLVYAVTADVEKFGGVSKLARLQYKFGLSEFVIELNS